MATTQTYLKGSKWNLYSPTSSLGNINGFILDTDNAISVEGNAYGMMDYNETNKNWNNYFTSSITGKLTSGIGYYLSRSSDGSVSAFGNITSGDYSVTLSQNGEGWNCIGNPYPSSLNINNTSETSFLSVNASNALGPSYACIYVWDPSTAKYQIIGSSISTSLSTIVQSSVASGQGFFVKSQTGGGTINFNAAMKTTALLATKAPQVPWPAIRLKVANSTDLTTTLFAFNNTMSKGLDPGYDAGLFRGSEMLDLYSHLVDDNGVDFAIQCLPETYESMIIPLGVDNKAGGEVTFSAETADLPSTCTVILEDKASSTFTTLTNGTSYTATVDANTTGTGRFFLHTSSATTGNNNGTTAVSDLTSGESLKVYAIHKVIYITGSNLAGSTATLYNISGMGYGSYKITSDNTSTLDEITLPAGVYVVHITNAEGKVRTFKVVME